MAFDRNNLRSLTTPEGVHAFLRSQGMNGGSTESTGYEVDLDEIESTTVLPTVAPVCITAKPFC